MNDIKIGSVVYSKAGRDYGRYYIVTALGEKEDLFYIVDGETRRLEKPKLKKAKHLRYGGVILEKLAVKLEEKKPIFDAEVRSALKEYNLPSQKVTHTEVE